MGEKLSQEIRIPAWALGALVTLFLALAGFTITKASVEATMRTEITALQDENRAIKLIDSNLQNTKLDKSEYYSDIRDMKIDLREIRTLLTQHVGK
jgi:hypothetical protein